MDSKKQWAVILLLTWLNLQHMNLKDEFQIVNRKVGSISQFLTAKFNYNEKGE